MTLPEAAWESVAERTWDAVVIGAGPAGAVAARQLALRGARVLLVDKKPFPRPKVCGACLNGAGLQVLESIGLEALPARLGGVPLDGLRLGIAGRFQEIPLPGGMAVSRSRFDEALVGAAVDAGARFLSDARASIADATADARHVRLTRRDRATSVSARVVVAASGLGGIGPADGLALRTRVERRSRVGSGCAVVDFPAFYRTWTIFMAVGKGGYVGLVRVEDGSLNAAAAFERRFLRASGGPAVAAARVLSESGFPSVPALGEAEWRGTVALTRETRPVAGERVFLIGDATGYVEPFTGEGMAWALMSAQAVESLAARAIEGWDPALARSWSITHDRLLAGRRRTCRAAALLLRSPRLASLAFAASSRLPGLTRRIIEHVNDAPALNLRVES
ncbi:MAG: FAD-dependent monooxygenase [Paludisphaera borealis]|uniref:NAD(P)/FAD-dependent oxidoreductase n=1 Tax=Paludisphaera borealis TaxID=1387353 RepID=UPI00283E3D4E|nr:FAD-dependent oxidoreductase [Paludisphaera borealis]MDR3622667.1 FAD-dependent monooxygenase [Paludisphaera borealis]